VLLPIAATGGSNDPTDSGGSSSTGGGNGDGSGAQTRALTSPVTSKAPKTQRASDPVDFVGGLVRSVADGLGPTVQPAAAAAVASTFGFPLGLMLAVLLFLIVQSRLDGRDPKFRSAPRTTAETLLPYADEEPS